MESARFPVGHVPVLVNDCVIDRSEDPSHNQSHCTCVHTMSACIVCTALNLHDLPGRSINLLVT